MNLGSTQSMPLDEATIEINLGQSKSLGSTLIKVPLVLPGETGCLSDVHLEIWEAPAGSPLAGRWLPPSDVIVTESFQESLNNAREAVNALDAGCQLWPADGSTRLAVRWWFSPRPPAEGVRDGSAGCIFALGLIALFRSAGLIPTHHLHRRLMQTEREFPFSQLSASAGITATGVLCTVDEDGLEKKEKAPGMKGIRHFILSRNQKKRAGFAAASTRQDHPCSNLNEALVKIAAVTREEPGIKAVERRPWLKWSVAAAAVVLSICGYFAYQSHLEAHPPAALLKSRLPMDVDVRQEACPADCSFVVELGKTTDYTWATRIWGQLQKVRSNFAMVLGGDYRSPHNEDHVSLGSFGELQGLRSLHVGQSEVTELQGAGNLQNLERFVDSGGRLRDLRWLDDLQRLRVLVLDSGHVETYPGFKIWSLDTLILRFPESTPYLSLGGCGNLRRLALRADGLTELSGLKELPLLEEVVLHLEAVDLEKLHFSPTNRIQSLELAHCKNPSRLGLEVGTAFPALRKLTLRNTQFPALLGLERASRLESLIIHGNQGLEKLDLTGMKNLQRLVVTDTPLKELKGLASCPLLREVVLEDLALTEISVLPGMPALEILYVRKTPLLRLAGVSELVSLRELSLAQTKLTKLEPLTRLPRLEFINMHDTLLEELPKVASKQRCFLNAQSTPLNKTPIGALYFQKDEGGSSEWISIKEKAFPNFEYSYEITPNYYLEPEFYTKKKRNKEDKPVDTGFEDGNYVSKYSLPDGSVVWTGPNGWSHENKAMLGERGFSVSDLTVQWGILGRSERHVAEEKQKTDFADWVEKWGAGGYEGSFYEPAEAPSVCPFVKTESDPTATDTKPPFR